MQQKEFLGNSRTRMSHICFIVPEERGSYILNCFGFPPAFNVLMLLIKEK